MPAEPMKDAAKKRRRYLWRLCSMMSLCAIGGIITIVGTIAAVILAQMAWTLSTPHRVPAIDMPWSMTLPFVMIPIVIASMGFWMSRAFLGKSRTLPYVPPLAGPVAALPAKDILVRGSDEPKAAPWELLRAAHSDRSAPNQELLRAKSRSVE